MATRSTKDTPPPGLQEPKGGWPRDNYTGHFGRFTRNATTGHREPADEETRKAMEALGIFSATGEIRDPSAATPAPSAPLHGGEAGAAA